MADWMEQQISNPDAVDEEEEAEKTKEATEEPEDERSEFEKQLRTLLATNSVESLEESVIEANIEECDDVEALQKAVEIEERDGALELYEDRLQELTGEEPDDDLEPEPDEEEASASDGNTPTEEEASDPEPEEEQEAEGEPEQDEDDSDSSPNPFASSGSEPAEEEDDGPEIPEDATEIEDEVVEMTDDDVKEAVENAEPVATDGNGGGSATQSSATVDVRDIAPDALTVTEAAKRERRWTTLVWAEPGMGKSHFGMTGESPVVVIDTEGKADELAHKFEGDGQYDDPFIFQPSDFDGAIEALNQALSLLDAFREQEGVIGTLVVDSMSVMWGWSQQKYVEKFYPHANDPSDVELSTGFGSGKSDWKQIKNYHNVQFRQRLIDSPYHLVWTAMSEDDYDAQINEGNRDAEKPAGEKENVYKVDEVLRIKEGPDGAPVGELQKSGKVKHRYTGLRYPTFPKHKKLIEEIDAAEAGDKSIASVESKFGVDIVEGNPAYAKDEDE